MLQHQLMNYQFNL